MAESHLAASVSGSYCAFSLKSLQILLVTPFLLWQVKISAVEKGLLWEACVLVSVVQMKNAIFSKLPELIDAKDKDCLCYIESEFNKTSIHKYIDFFIFWT